MNKTEFIERIPDICYTLEDCWCCALIAICIYYDIDYTPILINSGFFYQQERKNVNKSTFESIISNSVSITQTGEKSFGIKVDKMLIESEQIFLQSFVGLNGESVFIENSTIAENLLMENITNNIPIVAWIDTYQCPWNMMYGKYHFPHCFVIFDYDGECCSIFDALYQNDMVKVKFETIRNSVYYINCFTKVDRKIELSDIELIDLWKLLSDIFYKGENIFAVYEKTIKIFVDDIKHCDSFYNDVIDEKDEKVILLMRIFINNHQKINQAYGILKNSFKLTEEIDSLIQQEIKIWKIAGTLFVKTCYVPKEMRKLKLEKLYAYLDLLIINAQKKKQYYIQFTK